MIQSVSRAIDILRCFENRELLGITEISEMTALNKSTAFGIAATLLAEGLLEQDAETGRYRLGLELFRLGNLVNTSTRRLVVPELDQLVAELGETVNYVRRDGGDVVYLIKKESSHSMRICTKIGQRLPLYCTAVGKAILAHLPAEECTQILSEFRFDAYTEHTVPDAAALRLQMQQILRSGYAVEREEFEYGLVCVAVPVLNDRGYPTAAISCSGPKDRMTEEKVAQCRAALTACAKHLASILPN